MSTDVTKYYLGVSPGRRPRPLQSGESAAPLGPPRGAAAGSSSEYSPRHGPPTCPGKAPSPALKAGASWVRVGVDPLPSPHQPQQPTQRSRVQQQHSGSSGTDSIPSGGSSTSLSWFISFPTVLIFTSPGSGHFTSPINGSTCPAPYIHRTPLGASTV